MSNIPDVSEARSVSTIRAGGSMHLGNMRTPPTTTEFDSIRTELTSAINCRENLESIK
jgi:hypothetical protein